jgi:hypothetical protein
MWWTAIALAGVAAWFEWTYRRNRKSRDQHKTPPENTPGEDKLEESQTQPSVRTALPRSREE